MFLSFIFLIVLILDSSSCGGESTANTTYFTSPNYPNAWTSNSEVCTFTVNPRSFAKICQLRVDFEEFYISGPKSGVCADDMFVASGQDLNNIVPVICGQNSGQHSKWKTVYLITEYFREILFIKELFVFVLMNIVYTKI